MARLMTEHDVLRELTARIHHDLSGSLTTDAEAHLQELLLVLGPHVEREESRLFPRLRVHDELSDHVARLESEHASLYDDVDGLQELTDADGWCRSLLRILDDLGEHMYKEDFGLFPAALATLDGADWDAIDDDCDMARPGPIE